MFAYKSFERLSDGLELCLAFIQLYLSIFEGLSDDLEFCLAFFDSCFRDFARGLSDDLEMCLAFEQIRLMW